MSDDELFPLIITSLKLLNYPTIRENEPLFTVEFTNPQNRDLMINVLYWLLSKQSELKTRAYVAKYLKIFDI